MTNDKFSPPCLPITIQPLTMIRMIQSASAGHAKSYFADALSKSDYYINDQEMEGRFHGRLSAKLGLNQRATKDDFNALCENLHPTTGKPLTPRTNEDRTIGYDINFHCPKSVSILHALAKDDHILKAFEESVNETMLDIEEDSKTRVRKFGKQEDRETGELLWAEFTHQTSRPVDDHAPDPHLHSHCFVFNATWDKTEETFKAAQFRDIKRDMPYYQARFHKRLSDRMIELGYRVRLTDKSFEIEGVPQKVIDLFSKRTDEIGRVAKEKGITSQKELDALGARTRSKKQKGLTMAELKADWKKQMRDASKDIGDDDKAVRFDKTREISKADAKGCVDHALKHSFERASVMQDRRILGTAYKQALGNRNVSLEAISKTFLGDNRVIRISEHGRLMCTTKEVLGEEKRMVDLAKKGKAKLTPLYAKAPDLTLNDQQADAVSHVLTTSNRVSIVRGAAGTGKTTLMKEAVHWMEKAGKQVTVVAPTAQASRGVLKEEGFAQADTVARLLTDEQRHDALQNQILWVDEAGLLGTKDMTALLELAEKKNARLILGGDTRQHASVVRGDALRILNKIGGIATAEVTRIYRQRNEVHRSAVEDLSKGDVRSGFEKLDGLGAIKTIDPLNPNQELVNDYLKAIKKKKTALVISPTHKQGEAVTKDIRDRLRSTGKISKKEVAVLCLSNLNFTEAQKSDWRNFEPGQLVQFNQNLRGVKRGDLLKVKDAKDGKVILSGNGKSIELPTNKAEHFDVYHQKEIGLSKGDKVQITRNGFDEQEKRLNNGQALDVVSVSDKGKIILRNAQSKARYVVDRDFGHLTHAYCVTSHAAQGKTVDEVFIAQPASTFSATDAKQFYVSVSRGRDAVSIYTDDRDTLLEHAAELGERQSALELVKKPDAHLDAVERNIRREYDRLMNYQQGKSDITKGRDSIDKDYEPGI